MSKDKHHDFQEEQFYLKINPMSVDNRGKVIFSRLHDKSIGINKTKPIRIKKMHALKFQATKILLSRLE
jgi:hypothetical protein